jgi:HEAT repeat protein
METPELSKNIHDAVVDLQRCYMTYMESLKRVLDFGEANVPTLVAALNNKYANPVAKALGLMVYTPAWERAIPVLLDWLVVQCALYPDVLEALVRGGDKPLPLLKERIVEYAARGDDGAVRNFFDLAWRFSGKALPAVVSIAIELLGNQNADIREAAADVISRIALPHGRRAEADLQRIALDDPVESVRDAAGIALLRLGKS